MSQNMIAFFTSFFLITLAEMGDKTQLLIISLSAKSKPLRILLGVAIGTFFSHGLAILVGSALGNFSHIQKQIQLLAYLSFILFGFFSLFKKKKEEENTTSSHFQNLGIILTVAITIFIGEFGDKTQLASIALSTKFPNSSIFLIFGAISGMILADLVGIFVGTYMHKKIPKEKIEKISSIAFILFGILGFIQI